MIILHLMVYFLGDQIILKYYLLLLKDIERDILHLTLYFLRAKWSSLLRSDFGFRSRIHKHRAWYVNIRRDSYITRDARREYGAKGAKQDFRGCNVRVHLFPPHVVIRCSSLPLFSSLPSLLGNSNFCVSPFLSPPLSVPPPFHGEPPRNMIERSFHFRTISSRSSTTSSCSDASANAPA